MKFTTLKFPTKFDVYCGSKVVIPAGTENVKVAFRQSHLRRYDESTEKWIPMNVYIFKGKVYHA